MTQAINFTGERLANYIIEDICDFDTTKTYWLTFTNCGRWKLTSTEEYFASLPGYDVEANQQLIHLADEGMSWQDM